MRRLFCASALCSRSGQWVASSTLSSMRTDTPTTVSNSPQSKRGVAEKGSCTNRVRSMLPRQQQP